MSLSYYQHKTTQPSVSLPLHNAACVRHVIIWDFNSGVVATGSCLYSCIGSQIPQRCILYYYYYCYYGSRGNRTPGSRCNAAVASP